LTALLLGRDELSFPALRCLLFLLSGIAAAINPWVRLRACTMSSSVMPRMRMISAEASMANASF
jgi:hypothetical protein